jgi:hypothetical protein
MADTSEVVAFKKTVTLQPLLSIPHFEAPLFVNINQIPSKLVLLAFAPHTPLLLLTFRLINNQCKSFYSEGRYVFVT